MLHKIYFYDLHSADHSWSREDFHNSWPGWDDEELRPDADQDQTSDRIGQQKYPAQVHSVVSSANWVSAEPYI